jgi:hypothetical protein
MSTVDQISIDRTSRRLWPLERVLFLMAGAMTILSAVLLLTVFVGANQLAFVVFGDCPSSWLLRRYAGLERGCSR